MTSVRVRPTSKRSRTGGGLTIVVVSTTPLLKGTFNSHVLSLARALSVKHRVFVVGFGQSVAEHGKAREVEKQVSGSMYLLRRSALPWQHRRALRRIVRETGADLIHAQNYYASYLAAGLKAPGTVVHADLKGLVPDEALAFSSGPWVVRWAKYVAGKAMIRSFLPRVASVGVVSQAFANYLRRAYRYDRSVFVFPSLYDANVYRTDSRLRTKTRRELGLRPSDICIAYSGGFQAWQNIGYLAQLIRAAKAARYKFLMITQSDPEQFLRQHQLEEFRHKIRFVQGGPADVNRFLNAADWGYLVRQPHVVNEVSSPTKFLEYVATRNQVLISPGIGDFTEAVTRHKLGICIESGHDPAAVLCLVAWQKYQAAPDAFLARHSIQANIPRLEARYQEVLA